jgi:hypothetical protein
LNALREEDRKRAGNLTGITTALTEIALQRSQTVAFSRAKELTQRVETETVGIEKRTNARSLLEMLADSLTIDGKPKAADDKPRLSESQVEYLLGRLRKLSVDKTTAAADQLTARAIASAFSKGPTSPEFEGLLRLIAP